MLNYVKCGVQNYAGEGVLEEKILCLPKNSADDISIHEFVSIPSKNLP